MTAISKNVYFDVLDDNIDKYNNVHHRTIKMKPIDVKNDYFAEYNEESNEKDPTFKVDDHVRISKYKSFYGTKTKVEFNGSCLKQDKATYNHEKLVSIYIFYEISKNYNIRSYPALENCLFGAVSLTKNADIDLDKYSGYGVGFDREFSFGSRVFGRNCIILGADMSSSFHANNKTKNILVLGKDIV